MRRPLFFVTVFTAAIISLGYFSSATSGKSEKFIRSVNAVPERYIVVLDTAGQVSPGRVRAEVAAFELAQDYNGTVDKVFSSTIKGFSVIMSAENAEILSGDARVLFVEEDSIASVTSVQLEPEWGLDRIDQRDLPLNGNFGYLSTGSGVNVYVIDSGIRPTHVEFGGRASVAFDALDDGQNGIDCHGHGTHVAGTVGSSTYGVAKNANIFGVRVLPCAGFGLVSHVIMGIDWVVSNRVHPSVINMSIGVSGVSITLNTTIDNAVASGVTFVVAAGNNGSDACLFSPGSASGAIAVGATANNDSRPAYSNYGGCVDIFAPGNGILSLSHLDDTGTRVMNGTSMASPKVAGTAALFLSQNPAATPVMVRDAISLASTLGKVTNIDSATPNKLLYTWLNATTASISGRVITESGAGLRNTVISIFDATDGQTRHATTNSFGYYNLTNLRADDFYVVKVVGSKRYVFSPRSRSFSLNADLSDIDFTASSR
jgi:aqualysin 1